MKLILTDDQIYEIIKKVNQKMINNSVRLGSKFRR